MIVVDASVLVATVLDAGGGGALARRRVQAAGDLHVPHLADVEVTAALRSLVARQAVAAEVAGAALADYLALLLIRHPHEPLLGRCWELRRSVTAYDGTYVALAEALGCELVTADARLGRASGVRCEVDLLEI